MRVITYLAAGLLVIAAQAHAATFVFNTDPFAGTTALTTPGRQVVGGQGPEIDFVAATDLLALNAGVFGVNAISFANGLVADAPTSGVNVFVVQDTAPTFLAGNAANLIAEHITDPGPGFFVYFNTNLQVARLVYSTDLDVNTADLAVLARLKNFSGAPGFADLPSITAANFAAVPEPSSLLPGAAALLLGGFLARRRNGCHS